MDALAFLASSYTQWRSSKFNTSSWYCLQDQHTSFSAKFRFRYTYLFSLVYAQVVWLYTNLWRTGFSSNPWVRHIMVVWTAQMTCFHCLSLFNTNHFLVSSKEEPMVAESDDLSALTHHQVTIILLPIKNQLRLNELISCETPQKELLHLSQ